MPLKLKLTSQALLEKQFQGSTPGYNPLQVDEFIDRIIKDYRLVEANVLMLKKDVNDLNKQISDLSEANRKLEMDNIKYKSRLSNIKEGDNVTSENVELLKRINALEKFIYEKGFDPTKIK